MVTSADNAQPVIFLAFADSNETGLPRLADELRQVRKALGPAVKNGWCTLIERANATLEDILDVFQENRNQITIFHYGGHANSYQLLLATESGQLSEVNAGGFAEFLSQQENLRLVFLNGCSTEGQVNALLDAGIRAVIATSQDIIDDVAVQLAQRFYTGLGQGQSIQTAYNEAVATIRAQHGENAGEGTPWQLRIRPENNALRKWSLTEARESGAPSTDVGTDSRASKPTTINTEGGTYISGNVSVGGNFIGRDSIQKKK